MIVRTLDECRNSERRVVSDNWESVRMLLKDDNMGFSFHITTIYEGTETHIHYQNHLESVFCMSGEGEIEAHKATSAGRRYFCGSPSKCPLIR